MSSARPAASHITVRPLEEADLADADRIIRTAFGTFVGVPRPEQFFGDMDTLIGRFRADNTAGFAAESNGRILGANIATRWGSFGFFGPFGVHPDQWSTGVGRSIMARIMDTLEAWQLRMAGLFTFPHSPKHVGMYQRLGFSPRSLTAIVTKSLAPSSTTTAAAAVRYSTLSVEQKKEARAACRDLSDRIFEGLDPTGELRAIDTQNLGDTVLVWDDSQLVAFAACHNGPGTEAGGDNCYVKVALVRPGANAATYFAQLMAGCEAYARDVSATRVTAGVNTARREAYGYLCGNGYRIEMLGIAMHKPDDGGFSRPGMFVLDDWR